MRIACYSDVTKRYLTRYYEILEEMVSGMTNAALTESLSHNFIVQMIPHHRAAIEMSQNLLNYTTCLPLQRVAQSIITEQTQSIADMERVLGACEEKTDTACALARYEGRYKRITERMFCRMRTAPTGNCVDRNFILEMLPHHLGAIELSTAALRFDICRQLRPILKAIIASQEKGVRQMRALLGC